MTSDEQALKLIHLAERPDKTVDVPDKVFDYPVQDVVCVMCRHGEKYLIGRFRLDYEFCPLDWDFLERHLHGIHQHETLAGNALEVPEYFAGLKPKKLIRAYHSFMRLDLDFDICWHFVPFQIDVESEKFRINPDEKYSEFRWVLREELPEYSRQEYFEVLCNRTLDVDHLYVDDYTTVYDMQRGFYNFFPLRR